MVADWDSAHAVCERGGWELAKDSLVAGGESDPDAPKVQIEWLSLLPLHRPPAAISALHADASAAASGIASGSSPAVPDSIAAASSLARQSRRISPANRSADWDAPPIPGGNAALLCRWVCAVPTCRHCTYRNHSGEHGYHADPVSCFRARAISALARSCGEFSAMLLTAA